MTQRADRRNIRTVPRQRAERQAQELGIQQQIAFVSGLFQGDVTVRTVLESLAEGMVIVDRTGTILLVNSSAEKMFGYPKEELIGSPHTVLIPERFRKIHEQHEADYFASPHIRPMGQLLELAGRRRDGSEFPLEISLGFVETVNGVLVMALVSDMTLRKQFEARLRENEELFRIQVECTKDYAVFMLDAGGHVLNWNAGAERLTGYREDEIIKRHFSCFFPEPGRTAGRPAEELNKAAAEGRIEVEGWRVRKNGSRFWADVIMTALKDEHGNLRGFSKVTRDVSGRKKAQEEIKRLNARLEEHAFQLECANHELQTHQLELENQNEELRRARQEADGQRNLYQELYDFAPVGYFTLDEGGVIVEANLAGASLLGHERGLLVSRPLARFISRESSSEFELFRRRVLRSGSRERCEVRLGDDVTARWALLEGIAGARDEEGHAWSRVALIDISERKKMEEALRFSEDRYRALYDDNPTMIVTLSAELTVLSANPFCTGQLGYTVDELEGRSVLDLFHEDDRPAVTEQLGKCLRKPGQTYYWQFRKIRKDGGVLWVEEIAQAVYGPNGALHILVVCQDITERKRAEEEIGRLNSDLAARATELEAANRDLEAFNYTVAHDLRKPLTVVNGYCQAIRELCGDQLDEQCQGYLQEAYDGTWRMNRLIDALLDFSRLAHVEPQRTTVDLSALAHEVAAELKMAEPGRRVTLLIGEAITADGDAGLLRVVLANLLGNAWKYSLMREEAVIEFGVAESAGGATLFVRDNGAGFAMADADKLFVPFQRLSGAEKYRGFGIGLATVERIIRRHGGRVWAEGEPGKGATFYFILSGS